MTTKPPLDDLPPHVAEYVLGLMSEDEVAQFKSQLNADPDLRAELVVWTENLVSMTDDIAPVAPPARVLAAVEASLFGAPPEPQSRWTGGRFYGWLGGFGAALAAVFAVVMFVTTPSNSPANDLVADLASEDQALAVQVTFDPDTGILAIDRATGAPAQGRALELWLIAGDNPPVSLGLLPDERRGELIVAEQLYPLLDGAILAVSDEPLGGSPTGAPTGAVLLAGQIVGT